MIETHASTRSRTMLRRNFEHDAAAAGAAGTAVRALRG